MCSKVLLPLAGSALRKLVGLSAREKYKFILGHILPNSVCLILIIMHVCKQQNLDCSFRFSKYFHFVVLFGSFVKKIEILSCYCALNKC